MLVDIGILCDLATLFGSSPFKLCSLHSIHVCYNMEEENVEANYYFERVTPNPKILRWMDHDVPSSKLTLRPWQFLGLED